MANDLLEQTLPSIEEAIYPQRFPLLDWRMKEGDIAGGAKSAFKEKGFAEIRIPFEWGKYDRTVWFRTQVMLPDELSGKTVGIRLNMPEALVFVNGQPLQGFDKHHTEAIIFDKARRNQQLQIAVEAYPGRTRDKHLFEIAELVEVNQSVRTYRTSLMTLRDLEGQLDPRSDALARVREIIRRALIFVKYYDPKSDEYPNAIARGVAFLRGALGDEFYTTIRGSIHAVGQSHLDVVWLWQLAETVRKSGRTFSTALRMLERYPDFTYSQSQAVLYDLTKKAYPQIHSSIKQAISDGRWEAVGRTWVEPDCNIPSGESLIRQILHGSAYFRTEYGTSSDVFWLPDTFGYTWSLPQILRKSGFKYFFTTKLRWNDTTKFPHTAFHWQGIDGTRVLSYVPMLGLEASLRPQDLLASAKELDEDDGTPPAMQTFGYGDGGGGVTPEQIESLEVYRNVPGLPRTSMSTPGRFFKELEEHASAFPTWNGELYLEKHRGTYTTHAWLKKANRELEHALYIAEVLSCMTDLLPGVQRTLYPVGELDSAWKGLLLNQFHDIVPGTFIKEAREDIEAEVERVRASANLIIQRNTRALLAPQKRSRTESWFTILNPLSSPRDAYVEVDVPLAGPAFEVTDHDGKVIEHQVLAREKTSTRLLLYVPYLDGSGSVIVCVRTAEGQASEIPSDWKISARAIESPTLRVRFDNKGGLSAVFDKKLKKDILHKGKRGNLFQTFRDVPKDWEAWEMAPDLDRHRLDLFEMKGTKITEEGPLRVTVLQEYRSPNGSTIRQTIHMYHRTSRIDFDTTVRWKEEHTFLKVAFPLAPRTTSAAYEIQFGTIERPNRSKIPADKAKYEVPAQQWAALSDNKYGAAILNDSKYAYDCKDHTLRLSLIRSPRYPHPLEPWHLTDNVVIDQGEHQFRYALYPFPGSWRNGKVVAEARAFNVAPLVLPGRPKKPLDTMFSVNKPGVVITAFKRAEDGKGYVVRMYEAHGLATDCILSLFKAPTYVAECDLLEQDQKSLTARKGRMAVRLKPFEIKTFRILFSGKSPLRS